MQRPAHQHRGRFSFDSAKMAGEENDSFESEETYPQCIDIGVRVRLVSIWGP